MSLKNKKKSDGSTELHRQHHHEVKIVVLGAGGVGKSALTVQYVQGVFIEKYDPTIEDSYRKSVNLQITPLYTDKAESPPAEHHSFRLEILDTAGTEQFTAMRDLYYKSGDAFVLVYSITSTPTLHDLVGMREQLLRIKNAARVPMVLVGNKIDLANPEKIESGSASSQRVVSIEQGREVAEKWGVPFVETSARRNLNIERVFELLLQEYVHGREEKAFVTKSQAKKNGRKKCSIV